MSSARSIPAGASRSCATRTIGARDLGVNRGFWNFDEIRYDFYRDPNALHEAFKRGLFDVRKETDPARWEQGYDFPALRDGQVIKETLTSELPKPSFYFVFNTRRAVFADVRVREAIGMLFDFEWTNKNIFFGLYRRTASYFEGSELSAHGRPADARERALLAPFPGAVRADILDGTWSPPVSDGSGRDRAILRRALACSRKPATSCAAPNWSSARAGGRSPSRSWSPPAATRWTRSAWRCCSPGSSSAPASPSACGRSMRCNSRRAGSRSIST